MPDYRKIPIELIDPPELPSRTVMDQAELDDLAESVKTKGVLEPILVVETNGRFNVCAGHRRYLAAKMAYLVELPCMVYKPGEIDPEMATLEENLCREEVTAAEQGWWILELVERRSYSMPDLCRKFRRSEHWINERVELVRADARIAEAVAKREISFSVARELVHCKDEKHRHYLLGQAITHGLNVRTVKFMVDQHDRDQRAGLGVQAQPAGTSPAVPAPEMLSPHCVFCGLRDAAQNMVQVMVHFYHWTPIKKFLRDQGIEIHEAPKE